MTVEASQFLKIPEASDCLVNGGAYDVVVDPCHVPLWQPQPIQQMNARCKRILTSLLHAGVVLPALIICKQTNMSYSQHGISTAMPCILIFDIAPTHAHQRYTPLPTLRMGGNDKRGAHIVCAACCLQRVQQLMMPWQTGWACRSSAAPLETRIFQTPATCRPSNSEHLLSHQTVDRDAGVSDVGSALGRHCQAATMRRSLSIRRHIRPELWPPRLWGCSAGHAGYTEPACWQQAPESACQPAVISEMVSKTSSTPQVGGFQVQAPPWRLAHPFSHPAPPRASNHPRHIFERM